MTTTESDEDYEIYERLPRPPRRGSPVAVTAVAVLAVLGIIVASALVWSSRQINPSGEPGAKVSSIEVPSGSSFTAVTKLLEENDVISSARVMGWYAKFKDVDPVKAGEYVDFKINSSMADAIDVLNAGPVAPDSTLVKIIPGMWLSDALATITEAFPAISVESLQATLTSGQVTSKFHPDPAVSWEGYLLPETYEFAQTATPVEILQKIVDEFDSTLEALDYDTATISTGRTAQELVTIASMVERETGDPVEERAKIARVILNRLESDTPLGIDATILYGLQRKGAESPLTKSELETDGPYNSRTRAGLPPTAISLPSEASLAAAIAPADGPWIYYVLESAKPRAHVFTESYAEFQDAKQACRDKGLC